MLAAAWVESGKRLGIFYLQRTPNGKQRVTKYRTGRQTLIPNSDKRRHLLSTTTAKHTNLGSDCRIFQDGGCHGCESEGAAVQGFPPARAAAEVCDERVGDLGGCLLGGPASGQLGFMSVLSCMGGIRHQLT